MDNNNLQTIQPREIGVVTREIKELCRQANSMALMYAIEIGRRLVEAKSVLPYGKWGEWLKSEVNFSQSTANNFMKLFEEYGSQQITIFGAIANSQTIGKLPYSKALQLLSLPAEEREPFAEEVHAEDLSVKELRAAIEERNAAIREAEEAKARADELADRTEAAEAAKAEAEQRASEAEKLHEKVSELQASLDAANTKAEKLNDKLKKAKEDPQIPPETIEKIKNEAADAARLAAEKALSDELQRAKAAAESADEKRRNAERKAADAERLLTEARKELKTANPEVNSFKVLFDEVQKMCRELKIRIEKIRGTDPETADKLMAALKSFGSML